MKYRDGNEPRVGDVVQTAGLDQRIYYHTVTEVFEADGYHKVMTTADHYRGQIDSFVSCFTLVRRANA